MPGGALGVPGADRLIGKINEEMRAFDHVIASQDWHPPGHVSFSDWPVHCVQNTPGAEWAEGLDTSRIEATFRKGTDLHVDSYSVFGTGIAEYLRQRGITELFFVGVATDYCVLHSVLDALKQGFKVTVIANACRGMGSEQEALDRMRNEGAHIIS